LDSDIGFLTIIPLD